MQQDSLVRTKTVIIEHLRMFLQDINNYSDIYNQDYSMTMIYDKDPQELTIFPVILVTGTTGKMVTTDLGDFAQEIYDENGVVIAYRYSGVYDFQINLQIGTRTSVQRDMLTDLISISLRYILRRQIESHGILIKDMQFGNQSELPYDSDKIYISNISFSTFSEWHRDIKLPELGKINI
jgi:hypothetical protein